MDLPSQSDRRASVQIRAFWRLWNQLGLWILLHTFQLVFWWQRVRTSARQRSNSHTTMRRAGLLFVLLLTWRTEAASATRGLVLDALDESCADVPSGWTTRTSARPPRSTPPLHSC